MSDSSALIESLLRTVANDEPAMARAIESLDAQGRRELEGVIARFDVRDREELSRKEQVTATGMLKRIRKIETPTLELYNKVLDYLDLNASSKLEPAELELAVEVLDAFTGIASDNEVYSEYELELLLAVLRNLDASNTGRLERDERARLRVRLEEPRVFWKDEQYSNPLVREILER